MTNKKTEDPWVFGVTHQNEFLMMRQSVYEAEAHLWHDFQDRMTQKYREAVGLPKRFLQGK